MDIERKWTLTDDVEPLFSVVFDCKKDLTKLCFSKYSSAKLDSLDLFASNKICKLLMLHESAGVVSKDEEATAYTKKVGKFEIFDLHSYKIIDDKNIRIVAKFDVGEGITKIFYGNIEVLHVNV